MTGTHISRCASSSRNLDPRYKPLNPLLKEIRLLHIEPAGPDACMQCNFEIVSLLSKPCPEYWAVSYCWGSNSALERISLDGAPFYARKSAIEALGLSQSITERSTWWIDSICINQEDVRERAEQVAFMSDVYHFAERTFVYLGNPNGGLTAGTELCDTVSRLFLSHVEYKLDIDTLKRIATKIEPVYDEDALGQMRLIFKQPYFGRLWVFQELCRSQKPICYIDHTIVAWVQLELAFLWLIRRDEEALVSSESLLPQTTLHMRATRRNTPRMEIDLSILVTATRRLKCQDPRDRIFALLGMSTWRNNPESIPQGVRPDYTKCVGDCLRDALRVMIEEELNLDAFVLRGSYQDFQCPVEHPTNASCTLREHPSWCQGFLTRSEHLVVLNHRFEAHGQYEQVDLGLLRQSPPNQLILRGSVLDIVRDVSSKTCCTRANVNNDELAAFDQVYEDFGGSAFPSLAAKLVFVLGGGLDSQLVLENDDSVAAVIEILQDERSRSSGTPGLLACFNRKLLRTQSGMIGLGPAALESQDVIVILHGGKWPFALRKHGHIYRFVGQCYVPGAMFGEPLEEDMNSTLKTEHYVIE